MLAEDSDGGYLLLTAIRLALVLVFSQAESIQDGLHGCATIEAARPTRRRG